MISLYLISVILTSSSVTIQQMERNYWIKSEATLLGSPRFFIMKLLKQTDLLFLQIELHICISHLKFKNSIVTYTYIQV